MSNCFECKLDFTGECYRCLQVRLARENIAAGNGSQSDRDTIADANERR